MKTATSKDGTRIAYDRVGQGPVVIPVTGALGVRYRDLSEGIVGQLAPHFTVINYDRRGRGDSGDTLPYTVDREIEDIEALIDAAGGSAYLYGMSSGAVLALDAANKLSGKVSKLAMYEPPFIIDGGRPPVPADYVAQLNAAIAAGKPGDAVEIFMTKALLIPAEFVAHMRNAPMRESFAEGVKPPEWAEMEAVAHTLAYDGTIMGTLMSGKPLPTNRWVHITADTLVITGGNSEPFFHDGAEALATLLPKARHYVLEGQDHAVAAEALAPVLTKFFTEGKA
ncbi:MAG: alpha/beta hydrolase [Anaerolineae bacterium]|nr:alpha/beta hydrolase [Anaerolineae bacterium]